MAKLMIVEDEPDLADLLAYNLESDGHEVTLAATGAAALQRARECSPDAVLLDLMLPDVSGADVARQLRTLPSPPAVLMVTARGTEADRIGGFELGADDYVVKPFSVRELLMRVRAVLRRRSAGTSPGLQQAPITVDVKRHEARVYGEPVTLTALEFRLLKTLVAREGRVQTREVLLQDVWGIQADISTRTVDTHIKRLREKLGPAGDCVKTLRGVGYRLEFGR
ncbi:MAG: response regulator transcription factor [Deltaproteobacteria bacterium]|nr:response regulator transcription factor [Deltaproteobacteria bacterium]